MLKIFIPFVDEDKYQIIRFLEFLSNKMHIHYSIKELQINLGLSPYKTTALISEVLKETRSIKGISIINDNTGLVCTAISQSAIHEVILLEAKKSTNFKVFLHLFLNLSKESDADFAKRMNISLRTYFRLQQNLKLAIGKQRFSEITKSEIYTRYFIYQVLEYFSYFDQANDSLLTQKLQTKLKNGVSYLTLIWQLRPTVSQLKRFRYFAGVNILRLSMGIHLLQSDECNLVEIIYDERLSKLAQYFAVNWKLLNSEAHRFIRFCITFLMAGYSLPVSQFNLIKKAPEIFTLTTQQIKLIEEDEEKSRLIRNTDSYRDKLLRINAAVLSPLFTFRETTNFQNNIDPSLNNNTDILIQYMLNLYDKSFIRCLKNDEKQQLARLYYVNIATELQMEFRFQTVHIVVDFSGGNILTDYVTKGLTALSGLNLKVDRYITEKTDIYLTDTYNSAFNNTQLIWTDPPQIGDWLNLFDIILFKLSSNEKPL